MMFSNGWSCERLEKNECVRLEKNGVVESEREIIEYFSCV